MNAFTDFSTHGYQIERELAATVSVAELPI